MIPPTPAIIQHAYERLRSYGTPAYVVYMTDENGDIHRIAFRGSDEMMNDAQLIRGEPLPIANIYRAFVGPLSITVHEAVVRSTLGASAQPSATPEAQEQSSLVSDLRTIATVSAHAKPVYTVDDRGIETVDGYQDYHLQLNPTLDPTRYVLRDLWIDTTTYDVRRADYVTTDTNFPGATVYLTVNFAPVGPYWIAARWIALYHSPDLAHPAYRELEVKKMTFPGKLPDWLFDERAYEEHRRDHDVDYLHHLIPGEGP